MDASVDAPKPLLVVALGGNALLQRGEAMDFKTMDRNASRIAEQIAQVAVDYRVVITHGNGPQVGLLLEALPEWPLFVAGSETQGQIGSILALALRRSGLRQPVTCLVSHVAAGVSSGPPTKPVGRFFVDKPTSFPTVMDAKTKQWRKVVDSPEPLKLVELDAVKLLSSQGQLVICAGGGGIPIRGDFTGYEAVIDKDLTGSLLALALDADFFCVLTDVDCIFEHFQTSQQKPLSQLDAKLVTPEFLQQFPAGTMRPKIDACARFARNGKRGCVACVGSNLVGMLNGLSGTRILSNTTSKL